MCGLLVRSQTVIADGEWHHVGVDCDGSNIVLYVDDAQAAKGTQGSLTGSEGAPYIAAGSNPEPGLVLL